MVQHRLFLSILSDEPEKFQKYFSDFLTACGGSLVLPFLVRNEFEGQTISKTEQFELNNLEVAALVTGKTGGKTIIPISAWSSDQLKEPYFLTFHECCRFCYENYTKPRRI